MKVHITFEFEDEVDGVGGDLSYSREGIDDLYGLAHFFAFATRAAGFTYVENVGFEKEDGTVTFG